MGNAIGTIGSLFIPPSHCLPAKGNAKGMLVGLFSMVLASLLPLVADPAWAVLDLRPKKLRDNVEIITERAAQEQAAIPEVIARPTVEYRAENLRDPFKEPRQDKDREDGGSQAKLPDLQVQGIIWGTDIPQAIINNKVVKVGDTIAGGVRIVEINKDGVSVFFKNRNYNLSSPAITQLQSLQKKGGHDEK